MMQAIAEALLGTSAFLFEVSSLIMNNFMWSAIICGTIFWSIIGYRFLRKRDLRDILKHKTWERWYGDW